MGTSKSSTSLLTLQRRFLSYNPPGPDHLKYLRHNKQCVLLSIPIRLLESET